MKYYNFFPGFILVAIVVLLLVLNYAFDLNIPLVRNFKRPFLMLVILGFSMCAFGTIGHSMSNLVVDGKVDFMVIGLMATGALILLVSALAFFGKEPVWGFITKNSAFYIVGGLIVVKIVLATLRVMRLS